MQVVVVEEKVLGVVMLLKNKTIFIGLGVLAVYQKKVKASPEYQEYLKNGGKPF